MTHPVKIDGLTDDDAVHLLRAVRMWRNHARVQRWSLPAGFASIEPLLMSRGDSRRQPMTVFDQPLHSAETGPMTAAAKVYTLDEAASVLRYSVRTVQRRISSGALSAVRDGGITRIRVEDLDAYLDQKGA